MHREIEKSTAMHLQNIQFWSKLNSTPTGYIADTYYTFQAVHATLISPKSKTATRPGAGQENI